MYSCCNIGKTNKTKIIILSAIGASILAASYYFFISPNNGPVLALSGLLGLAACPAMCAVMGGAMWMASRLGSKKNQKANSENTNQQSCCAKHSNDIRKEKIEN